MSLVYQIETNLTSYFVSKNESNGFVLGTKKSYSIGGKQLEKEWPVQPKEDKQVSQAANYKQNRPLQLATQKSLNFNTSLTVTPEQEKLMRRWTESEKQRLLLCHTLACQLSTRKKNWNSVEEEWVPIPYTFLDEFYLRGVDKQLLNKKVLVQTEFVNKGAYRKGSCRRFQLAPELLVKWNEAGLIGIGKAKPAIEKVISKRWNLNTSRIHARSKAIVLTSASTTQAVEVAPNISTALEISRVEPEVTYIKSKLSRALLINVPALLAELNELKLRVAGVFADKNASDKNRIRIKAQLDGAARCISLIIARSSKIKSSPTGDQLTSQGIVEYYPEYIQKNAAHRRYEIGGGYQNLSKNFKEAARIGTNQGNYDFEACHPNLFVQMYKHITGKSSVLAEILKDGGYPKLGLMHKTTKQAVCATLNQAQVFGLKALDDKAILNILRKDPSVDESLLPYYLKKITAFLKPLASEVKVVKKYVLKHYPKSQDEDDHGCLSFAYQLIEQQLLAVATNGNEAANEHDGWVGDNLQLKGTATTTTEHFGPISINWSNSSFSNQNVPSEVDSSALSLLSLRTDVAIPKHPETSTDYLKLAPITKLKERYELNKKNLSCINVVSKYKKTLKKLPGFRSGLGSGLGLGVGRGLGLGLGGEVPNYADSQVAGKDRAGMINHLSCTEYILYNTYLHTACSGVLNSS